MIEPNDFRPSATLEMLRLRAKLLAAVRRFFDERGYWEVDTPLLSSERVIDPHLEPYEAVPCNIRDRKVNPLAPGRDRLYLQTSPEFAMKRLLAAGAEAIYQVGHVFRAGESGRQHNPEFTMIEWYRVGDTHMEQMQVAEDLTCAVWSAAGKRPDPKRPFQRTVYRDAFVRETGTDVMTLPASALKELAHSRNVAIPDSLSLADHDGWLNLLLAEIVEPRLGRDRPEFLCDYPASQASLARIRNENPPVAERFELYVDGIELCNGYHELSDTAELRRRVDAESRRRGTEELTPLPVPLRLLQAMEQGLPPCSGVALGFDRLMMIAIGAKTVAEVLPFAMERA